MLRVSMVIVMAMAMSSCFAVAGPASGSRASPLVILGEYQMGGFRSDMKLGDARRVFGKPTRMTPDIGTCEVRWKESRTVMLFWSCGRAARFIRFVGSGLRWRTGRGLAVGAAASAVRKLYPHARPVRVGAHKLYVIIRGFSDRQPALGVWVTKGKVTALIVSHGGTYTFSWS
jgi:hypothetical protein